MTRSNRTCALAIVLIAAAALPLASSALATQSKHLPAHPAQKRATNAPAAPLLTVDAVNAAQPLPARGAPLRAMLLRAQILLDRAHFSSGEIDAYQGANLKKAIAAFQKRNEIESTGALDAQTWQLLNRDAGPALVDYTITEADAAGPFLKIPPKMADKALLPAMAYSSPVEALAEKFHLAPRLLQQLNPRKDFGREGTVIVVPNVGDQLALPKMDKGARVVISKSASSITLLDAANNVVAHFPASTGSEHDPLPIGTWKINGVARNPKFHYNPQLFWDAAPDEKRATIPPGPNNPVGVVWIDLSKPHYGIHGTPEPSAIGRTQSHGCIRMTNWDAWALANAVYPGMTAELVD